MTINEIRSEMCKHLCAKIGQLDCTECIVGQLPQWIQCSERMPEEEGRYLVTRGFGLDTYTTFCNWHKGEWIVDCIRPVDVIAWMPLPEPYKDGEQDG